MAKRIEIKSPNVIRNKDFRSGLSKMTATSSDEAFEVVRQGILNQPVVEDEAIKFSFPNDNEKTNCELSRSELEVKAKLFLRNFDSEAAFRAIHSVLSTTGLDYLDSLQISVPSSCLQCLAIAAEAKPKTEGYRNCVEKMTCLWKDLETLVEKGTVKALGLCDIELDTLVAIFDQASVKPSSIALNLASCCVVPPELQTFAKEHNLRLTTHNDAGDILSDRKLEEIQNDQFKNLKTEWVIRYQIMDASRGVLKDKCYVIGLKSD